MRTYRHWTPRYIVNRVALRIHESRHPEDPWLTASAVGLLSTLLRPTDIGVEWGAGRSTIWLAKRVAAVSSVEHNPQWYLRVGEELKKHSLRNVNLQLRNADNVEDGANEYASVIDSYNDCSLDFVLVDGVERDLCANKSLSKLKYGGILVIDNCNRYLPSRSLSPASLHADQHASSNGWRLFQDRVRGWRYIWTSNGVSDTGVWIKNGWGVNS